MTPRPTPHRVRASRVLVGLVALALVAPGSRADAAPAPAGRGGVAIARGLAPGALLPAGPGAPGDRLGLHHPPLVVTGAVPEPDDTIHVTASQAYLGQAGTGRGYVLLAPGHAALTNPVLVVEGFDLDNLMDWDELYTLLNQQALVESLLADGHDAVVLDFADATTHIQRNAFVFTELLAQVEQAIDPAQSVAVVGASMGGLVARYGLAWLEAQAVPHRVRTFLSFDAPQRGANIPLGLQHWVNFYAGQSTAAAAFRDILDSPAARQMLVHHFRATAGTSAGADPLRATLLADLAAVGGYPSAPRRVAFANGAADGAGQGFAPAAQLIDYDFDNGLVLLRGDVWAVSAGVVDTVFAGRIRILFISNTVSTIQVGGTRPYDSAPGGWRASMAQLADSPAPYGDIVALADAHCFIPTVSALDVDDADLGRDLAAVPGLVAESPFDALYWAQANEEHVFISPETAARVRAELAPAPVAVEPARVVFGLEPPRPHPAREGSGLRFTLPAESAVTLDVLDVAGRRVRTLVRGRLAAGPHARRWDLCDDSGRRVAPGLYFVRLAGAAGVRSQRLIALP